jgi:outer membrane protein assembly factor BamB
MESISRKRSKYRLDFKGNRTRYLPSWTRQIGLIGYASPILGPNGTIYLGTLGGQLVAINPDGSLLWQKDLKAGHSDSTVTASLAVDSQGAIYVIDTYVRENRIIA